MTDIVALASQIKRWSRDPRILELCDEAIALGQRKLTQEANNKLTPNCCPKCEAARKVNAEYQRRFRSKRLTSQLNGREMD